MHEQQPQWSPARLAYGFYTVAAAGAVIGQTWVALTHVPWTPGIPGWLRVAAVLPFALCLELLAMALAAMADQRMRLGERAYGFRVFSALVATVAVGILVLGHWPHYYWSAAFGVLSSSAYLLWLLHSAARRRDALRVAGKLADTAPDYGLWRRLRYPIWTARAAQLAREGQVDPHTGQWRPLGLYESLRAAQQAMRAEKRRPAVAKAVEQVVRGDHHDPRMADIAIHTLDLDRLAAELEHRVNYTAWADRLAPAVSIPAVSIPPGPAAAPTPVTDDDAPAPQVMQTSTPRLAASHPRVGRRRRVPVHRGRPDIARAASRRAASQTSVTRKTPSANAPLPVARPVDDAAVADAGRVRHAAAVGREHGAAPDARTAGPTSTAAEHHTTAPVPTNQLRTQHSAPAPQPPPGVVSQPSADAEANATSDPTTTLSKTAAAVAYWRKRHPQLRPAEIAARVGKSERQVRRILAALDKPNQSPDPTAPRRTPSPAGDSTATKKRAPAGSTRTQDGRDQGRRTRPAAGTRQLAHPG